jgi:LmbE family N-acetylglucosaminyl deacetylase
MTWKVSDSNRNTRLHLRSSNHQPCAFSSPKSWASSLIEPRDLLDRPVFMFAHPDDAVFSAFFALSEAAENGLDLIVCARNSRNRAAARWDRLCGFTSARHAQTVRFTEHAEVCKSLGVSSFRLNVLDKQYGGSHSRVWSSALNRAAQIVYDFKGTVLVTHSLVAVHPDHRKVVTLARKLSGELQIPILHTCDRPYFECTNSRCSPRIASHGMKATSAAFFHLTPRVFKAKLAAISFYASQQGGLVAAFGTGWNSVGRLGNECYLLKSERSDRKLP